MGAECVGHTEAERSFLEHCWGVGQGVVLSASHCCFCVLQEMANSVYLVMEVSSCSPGRADREAGLSWLLVPWYLGVRSWLHVCGRRATPSGAPVAVAGA